jgi:hypothetical protein
VSRDGAEWGEQLGEREYDVAVDLVIGRVEVAENSMVDDSGVLMALGDDFVELRELRESFSPIVVLGEVCGGDWLAAD